MIINGKKMKISDILKMVYAETYKPETNHKTEVGNNKRINKIARTET
jgi:hypothetical protein